MTMNLDEKQKVLELASPKERVEYLVKAMQSELDVLQVEKKIRGRVKQQMEKLQRKIHEWCNYIRSRPLTADTILELMEKTILKTDRFTMFSLRFYVFSFLFKYFSC